MNDARRGRPVDAKARLAETGRDEATVRIPIRVRPGASRTRVGGRHDDRLVVAVTARAVDGAATTAALAAVADALGLKHREVTLAVGRTSRDKLVEVPSFDGLAQRWAELLDLA